MSFKRNSSRSRKQKELILPVEKETQTSKTILELAKLELTKLNLENEDHFSNKKSDVFYSTINMPESQKADKLFLLKRDSNESDIKSDIFFSTVNMPAMSPTKKTCKFISSKQSIDKCCKHTDGFKSCSKVPTVLEAEETDKLFSLNHDNDASKKKSDVFINLPSLTETKNTDISLNRSLTSKADNDETNKRDQCNFQVESIVDKKHLDSGTVEQTADNVCSVPQWSRFTVKEIRVKSFDNSKKHVIKEYKNHVESESDSNEEETVLYPVSRRGRSLTPPTQREILSCAENSTEELNISETSSGRYRDYFHLLIFQIKSKDWNVALKALVSLSEKIHSMDKHRLYSHMTEVNQRLIEFLRSPRSQVCRSSCQVARIFFETIKDTRRPEFDDIVELLLMKTADSNKFIRKDANLALDSLIMYVSPFHTIRAISQKGPSHKNDLVRISSARLFVCIVGIAGVNLVLNQSGSECTRERIFTNMARFVKDKNFKTREYGIRLFRLLHEHPNFEFYLKKFLSKNTINDIKKIIKKV